MTQPEMSYAPAYYQDRRFSPAYHESGSPVSVPAAYLPPDHRQSLSRHSLDRSALRHPSDPSSASPPPAGSPPYHYRSASSSHPSRPPSERPPTVPASFVSSSRLEHGSILTGSSNSSGAASKEDRTRGSWTDRASLMSSDNQPSPGVSRVQKQHYQDGEDSADGEDGLLMFFRLSIPVPIYSFGASIYAIFAILIVTLTHPLRLCSLVPKSASYTSRLCGLLVPALHVHERLVRSPIYRSTPLARSPPSRPRERTRSSSPQTDERPSSTTQWIYNDAPPAGNHDLTDAYSVPGLLTVLILSAYLCVPLLLVTWTVAFFWVFAKILGNPDGTERQDDGRAALLGVTHWWQNWLQYGRRIPE